MKMTVRRAVRSVKGEELRGKLRTRRQEDGSEEWDG